MLLMQNYGLLLTEEYDAIERIEQVRMMMVMMGLASMEPYAMDKTMMMARERMSTVILYRMLMNFVNLVIVENYRSRY